MTTSKGASSNVVDELNVRLLRNGRKFPSRPFTSNVFRSFVKLARTNMASPSGLSQRAHSPSGVFRSVVRFPQRSRSSSAMTLELTKQFPS